MILVEAQRSATRPTLSASISATASADAKLGACKTASARMTRTACSVTHGACRALVLRAANSRVRPSALVRGAIIDLLEGRGGPLRICTHVGQMWDDPQRYWLQGEGSS